MENTIHLITFYGLRIIGVLILLILTWFFSGLAQKLVGLRLEKAGLDPTLVNFTKNAVYWLLMVLGAIAALGMFGVQLTAFAAVLGAAGLAIGLAFQGSLSNVAAGIMLLIFRPFKVGQVISVAGKTGKVVEIGLFTTNLDTPQNLRIIIPNSQVFGSTIENFGFHDTRRADVIVGTEYSADLEKTRETLWAAVAAVEKKLESGSHAVVLVELGDSSVNWAVRVWASSADYWAVLEDTTRQVKRHLDQAGIGIPFPQMDVHLDKVDC